MAIRNITATLVVWVIAAVSYAQPATRSATQPDYSSPDKTWATVCAALKADDLAAFRACFHNSNEISKAFMDAYSDTTLTTFRLANAIALLGDQGKAMSKKLQSTYTDLVASGENRKTEIAADTATWKRIIKGPKGPTEEVMYFKKVKNQWLIDTYRSYAIDTIDGRQAADDFISTSSKQLTLLKQVISDIKAKRITTIDQMRKLMTQ